jgi:hypothetical protein
MSTEALSKARLRRMHEVMAGYVERDQVPGIVTLVSRRFYLDFWTSAYQAIDD